jgi:hypothetical protein
MGEAKRRREAQMTDETEPKPEERCEVCRFALSDGENFSCRRYPPQMVVMNYESAPVIKQDVKSGGAPQVVGTRQAATGVSGQFPTMTGVGWCGEFSMRKSAMN